MKLKVFVRPVGYILASVLQACAISYNVPYYLPEGEGEIVDRDEGQSKYLKSTIGEKVIFEVALYPERGLRVMYRVPDGNHINLTSDKFVIESSSINTPLILRAKELESDPFGPNKGKKYKISDDLPGYTVTFHGFFKPYKDSTHAWYSLIIPIDKKHLDDVTVYFPDILINNKLHQLPPVNFEKRIGTFFHPIN